MKSYYVYILASGKEGTLYIGTTNDLIARVDQHKRGIVDGFTKKYKVDQLVYYEANEDVIGAITREKQLKNGKEPGKSDLLRGLTPSGETYTAICCEVSPLRRQGSNQEGPLR